MRSPTRTGINDGAITSQATPISESIRSRSNPPGPSQPIDKPPDRGARGFDLVHIGLPADRWERRGDDRQLVHVKTDPQTHIGGGVGANVRHGWSSGCMRLWPTVALSAPKLTREPATREGQPPRV